MPEFRIVGSRHGIEIAAAAWDGARAEADLSCACMFEREAGGPAGGLLHLDQALGGALTALRRDGHFRARPMETLFLDRPPETVRARAILIVGLGDPDNWSVAVTARAAATALGTAMRTGAASAAFAPSILDSGLSPSSGADMPAAMMDAVLDAVAAQARLAALGLAGRPALRRWVFDVGAARFAAAAEQFEASLSARPA